MSIKDFSYFAVSRASNIIFPIILLPFILISLGSYEYVYFVRELSATQIMILFVKFGTEQLGLINCERAKIKNKDIIVYKLIWEMVILRLIIMSMIFPLIYIFLKIINYEISVYLLFYTISEILMPIFVFQVFNLNRLYAIIIVISKILIIALMYIAKISYSINIEAIWLILTFGSILPWLTFVPIANSLKSGLKYIHLNSIKKNVSQGKNFFLNAIGSALRDRLYLILAAGTIEPYYLATFDILYRYALAAMGPINILSSYYLRIFSRYPRSKVFKINKIDYLILTGVIFLTISYVLFFNVIQTYDLNWGLNFHIDFYNYLILFIAIGVIPFGSFSSWVVNTRLFTALDSSVQLISFVALLISILSYLFFSLILTSANILILYWVSTFLIESILVYIRLRKLNEKTI